MTQGTRWMFVTLSLIMRLCAGDKAAPNIVFVIADDLGWNDVSYHGSDLNTPVIDELARSGVRLEQHYTQPECSTTRASLLTSRYVVRTGLQNDVILNGGGQALPETEVTWANYMKELGYENYLVGKWHQGMNSWEETPVFRGFDYFYGYYGGQIHYFAHYHTKFGGHDFRRDYRDEQGNFKQEILKNELGGYLPKLLTDDAIRIIKDQKNKDKPMFMYFSLPNVHSPNQSPKGYISKYCPDGIEGYDRKQLAGNLGGLEESMKNLTDALKETGEWDNTILVFISDNGGAPVGLMSYAGHSNYPLRAGKTTLFEGGVRTPAFIAGPYVRHLAGSEVNGMFHVSDWMPTLTSLIKKKTGRTFRLKNEIDGVDNSEMVFNGGTTKRKEMLLQINKGNEVLRMDKYKLIVGNAGEYDGYLNHQGRPEIKIQYDEPMDFLGKVKCSIGLCGGFGDYIIDPTDGAKVRLFDLEVDPSETYNIAGKHPDIVARIRARIDELRVIVRKPQDNSQIPEAHHKKSGGIWKPWRNTQSINIDYNILTKTEL